jgi:hypothetical protein
VIGDAGRDVADADRVAAGRGHAVDVRPARHVGMK